MSILSFDFIDIENQLQQLSTLKIAVDKEANDVYSVINSVSEMELGDTEDELRHLYDMLNEERNRLVKYIARLKKISELYTQCECSIIDDVDNLSLNMPKQMRKNSGFEAARKKLPYSEWGTYFGNSIINDDRLEKLIFEKEGLK